MDKKVVITGISGVLVLAIIAAVILSGNDQKEVPVSQAVDRKVTVEEAVETKAEAYSQVASVQESVEEIVVEEPVSEPLVYDNMDALPEDDPEPVHLINGMNPEDQPRAFQRVSFEGMEGFPDGFIITGDAYLSDRGWVLGDVPDSLSDIPRSALIESPTYKMDFPSNAISTGWKEISPEGTEVLVELAASPDGKNWTSWYPTTGAHMDGEIVEFNEITGERNPNYGFTLGDMVYFGLGQYEYYKYSIMLYSEIGDSPLVSGFFVYQQDTTMGEGAIVGYSDSDNILNSEEGS